MPWYSEQEEGRTWRWLMIQKHRGLVPREDGLVLRMMQEKGLAARGTMEQSNGYVCEWWGNALLSSGRDSIALRRQGMQI